MRTPKFWRTVNVQVRYPDEKHPTTLVRQTYSRDVSEACRIAIKQVLASEAIEALLCARVAA